MRINIFLYNVYNAYNKGVSLDDILKAGAWINADTFINHYYASDTPVSQIILNVSPPEG